MSDIIKNTISEIEWTKGLFRTESVAASSSSVEVRREDYEMQEWPMGI